MLSASQLAGVGKILSAGGFRVKSFQFISANTSGGTTANAAEAATLGMGWNPNTKDITISSVDITKSLILPSTPGGLENTSTTGSGGEIVARFTSSNNLRLLTALSLSTNAKYKCAILELDGIKKVHHDFKALNATSFSLTPSASLNADKIVGQLIQLATQTSGSNVTSADRHASGIFNPSTGNIDLTKGGTSSEVLLLTQLLEIM